MKKLFSIILLFFLLISLVSAQEGYVVRQDINRTMSQGAYTALILDIKDANAKDVKKDWEKFMKTYKTRLKGVKKHNEDLQAGFIKLKLLWPFPDGALTKAIRQARKIIVPEMNIGKISREIQRIQDCDQELRSVPKLGGLMHTPMEILEAIRQ